MKLIRSLRNGAWSRVLDVAEAPATRRVVRLGGRALARARRLVARASARARPPSA